jgi:hypothetical protein
LKSREAVKFVAEYVRETGTPAADAVRKLWSDIKPITDPDQLIQFALACQVATEYKMALYVPGDERRPYNSHGGGTRVSAVHHKSEPKVIQVSVSILQDIHYNVEGRVKSIAVMNRRDVLILATNFCNMVEAFSRHEQVFRYIAARLVELKKEKVEDLAEGEQQKIARMFTDLKQFKFPKDLPGLPVSAAG